MKSQKRQLFFLMVASLALLVGCVPYYSTNPRSQTLYVSVWDIPYDPSPIDPLPTRRVAQTYTKTTIVRFKGMSQKPHPVMIAKKAPQKSTTAQNDPPPMKKIQIALLVPMQGPRGSQGQALVNGFLAAYWHVPEAQRQNIHVKVYDIGATTDRTQSYQLAKHEGASIILEPLGTSNQPNDTLFLEGKNAFLSVVAKEGVQMNYEPEKYTN